MAAVTWLGDEDPSVQTITQYGHTFVKGVPTEVPENDPNLGKFKNMVVFSVGKDKAEPVESVAPEPVDPDKGTEIAAVRAQLDTFGIRYDGRSSLENLRAALAKAQAKAAE